MTIKKAREAFEATPFHERETDHPNITLKRAQAVINAMARGEIPSWATPKYLNQLGDDLQALKNL